MKKYRRELSQPIQADNAEERVKWDKCGAMFGVGLTAGAAEVVSCPVCGHQINLRDAVILGASNEDY